MSRPEAPVDDLAADFFAWHRRGELRLQRCPACTTYLHPPRLLCPTCLAGTLEWAPVSGQGTVFSWIVTHRALTSATAALGVYVSALVELAEGPRLLTRLVGVEPDEVRAGLPVSVAYEPDPGDVVRAVFRPAE
jgi:uncharacterized OB-fold protein